MGGFSLVELMVVIAIIAILVGLLVVGAGSAIGKAKEARIKMEVAALAQALERFKQEYGEYPPDFTSGKPLEEVNRHMARKFRYRVAAQDIISPPVAIGDLPLKPGLLQTLDPNEALYFWLRGFHADQKFPIRGTDQSFATPDDRTPLFEFDRARLTDRDNDGNPEYTPQGGLQIPFLYYRNNNSIGVTSGSISPTKDYISAVAWATAQMASGTPVCGPYRSTTAQPLPNGMRGFAEANKFQIISAGLDGEYIGLEIKTAGLSMYPSGQGYSDAERDNITNFTQGTTLEDDIP
jgi:prepilin-type N-terminal cleavage/methylation domain-containing protein